MPMQTTWIEPELFVEHQGVRVFHTYKNDDWDQGQKRYWFTLHRECSTMDSRCEEEPCRHVFDVRELPTWQPPVQPPYCTAENDTPENHAAWEQYWSQETEVIKVAIRAAIERGALTAHGFQPERPG